jgi:FkbM family methyltransferase
LRAVNCAASIARLFGGKERKVELWKSAPFHVNLTDRIQRQMWLGCYEPHVNRVLSALLAPGSVFLDVGANIGYHSYFAAGVVGPTGVVRAFEPDPDVHTVLARNLSCFPWACSENAAVWDSSGWLEFERSFLPAESGWGALTAVRNLNKGQCISVRTVSLDSWKGAAGLPAVDMIKLDAEGAELRILAGARSILSKFRPVLLLEVSAPLLTQGGSSPSALIAELTSLNYATFILEDSRISNYSAIPDYHTVDCICLHHDRAADILKTLSLRGFQT